MNWMQISTLCLVALAGPTLAGCDRSSSSRASGSGDGNFEASLSTALGRPDPYQRVHDLAVLLPSASPGDVPALKQSLETGKMTGMGVAEFELLVRRWASLQPEAATDWVLHLSPTRLRLSAIELAVETWARRDPRATVAGVTWATQGLDRELAQAVQQGLVRGWFQADRRELMQYIENLGEGPDQQRSLLAYAIALLDAEGPDAVTRWADAVPGDNERFKIAVYQQAAAALAWGDPPAAERWCAAVCEAPYGQSLRGAIARIRIQNGENVPQVLEWLSRAPAGTSQAQALVIGYQLWALRDPDAALQWMQGKLAERPEPEPWIRILYGSYARQLARTSPREALQWAEKMEVESAREEMMIRIARKWRRQDEAAAETWLKQSPLSEEQRANARNLDLPDYIPEPLAPAL